MAAQNMWPGFNDTLFEVVLKGSQRVKGIDLVRLLFLVPQKRQPAWESLVLKVHKMSCSDPPSSDSSWLPDPLQPPPTPSPAPQKEERQLAAKALQDGAAEAALKGAEILKRKPATVEGMDILAIARVEQSHRKLGHLHLCGQTTDPLYSWHLSARKSNLKARLLPI